MANLRADNLCGTGGRNAIDGSVLFSTAAADWLKVGSAGDFNFLHNGASDFTAEFWVKPGLGNSRQSVFSTGGNSSTVGFTCRIMEDGATGGSNGYKVLVQYSRGSSGNYLCFLGGTLTVGEWAHVALVFTTSNKQLAVYVNGQLTNSSDLDGTANGTFGSGNFASGNSTNSLQIGREPYGTTMHLHGAFLSNLRIVEGVTVYTAAFTPPTEKLTAIDGTDLLCCQDSDDPTQEALGKTITGYGNLNKVTDDVELVTNGHFNTDVSGWTVTQGAFQWTAGQAEITSPATTISQNITTVVGKRYRIEGTANDTANTSNNVGMTLGSRQVYLPSDSFRPAAYTFTGYWTATSTTTVAQFWGGTDALSKWSNVSVKLAESPKQSSNSLPPVGVDEGVTFGGETKHNTQGVMYFPTGDTSQRGRGRGVYMLGYSHPSGGEQSGLEYFDIQSSGNTTKFGDLTTTYYNLGSGSSATRGVWCGGYDGASSPDTDINNIEYITIATTGNTKDFGDRTTVGRAVAAVSSETRVCMAGGNSPHTDTIDYITTASVGNATDFGNLGGQRTSMCNSAASTTRGVFAGGYQGSPVSDAVNTIEYITIASTGNATNFGDLTHKARDSYGGTVSSNTRGCIAQATATPALTNTIDYVTIASTGNAADFGDLTVAKDQFGSCSNSIRGVFIGGRTPTYINSMDYIIVATTGNATDFGDVSRPTTGTTALGAALSDSHGGLS